ncbi:MAG TPA: HIT domain-containing protein [Actinomycetota bacterium]|nr:HIT domain-containing protein [Actinomycetota bacterium]
MTGGLERLWAPWRMEYIGSASSEEEQGCIFCELPAKDDDEATYILARQEHSFAILNKFPYNSGHLMVAPFRHVGNLEELKDDESLDMQKLLGRCVQALKEAMEPNGFNVGMNLGQVAGAGIPDHIHWHVVPRWSGDTNFMPLIGETKVLPELLRETYEKMRPGLR